MTKVKMIATDTILASGGLKHAGDDFEVKAGKDVEKMSARGHLVADTKEAEAFLAKKSGKKNFSTSMTENPKPSKHPFNSEKVAKVEDDDEDEVPVKKTKAEVKKGKNKKGSGDLA